MLTCETVSLHGPVLSSYDSPLQDVLFESKLASMCLMPKIIDEDYLTPAELAFLTKHAPNVRRRCDPPEANVVVYTHTYDSVRSRLLAMCCC